MLIKRDADGLFRLKPAETEEISWDTETNTITVSKKPAPAPAPEPAPAA